jgi:hypothetical protein
LVSERARERERERERESESTSSAVNRKPAARKRPEENPRKKSRKPGVAAGGALSTGTVESHPKSTGEVAATREESSEPEGSSIERVAAVVSCHFTSVRREARQPGEDEPPSEPPPLKG